MGGGGGAGAGGGGGGGVGGGGGGVWGGAEGSRNTLLCCSLCELFSLLPAYLSHQDERKKPSWRTGRALGGEREGEKMRGIV